MDKLGLYFITGQPLCHMHAARLSKNTHEALGVANCRRLKIDNITTFCSTSFKQENI